MNRFFFICALHCNFSIYSIQNTRLLFQFTEFTETEEAQNNNFTVDLLTTLVRGAGVGVEDAEGLFPPEGTV